MTWRAALLFLGGCSFSVPGGGGVQPDDANPDAPRVVDASADAAIDAMIDAPVISPLNCPVGYIQIAGSLTKYRPIYTLASYWQHEASCEADTADKKTHAAVIDSLAEAAAIRTYLLAQTPVYKTFGVGAVQNPSATTVGGGWVDFRDRVLDPALWGSYAAVQQPDDGAVGGAASPENHEQNLAFLDLESTGTNPYLRDGNGAGANYVFLCECDGFAVGTTAQGYVDNDVNNPN
jgi:hypothetical protein